MTTKTPRDPLTPHETAVLAAAAIGLTQADTARRLCMSPRTMRRMTSRAMRKLDAVTRTQAVAVAVADGLIDPEHVRARTLPNVPPYDRTQSARGFQRTHAELTPAQISEAVRLRAAGRSYRSIADEYGVPISTLYVAINGRKRRRVAA